MKELEKNWVNFVDDVIKNYNSGLKHKNLSKLYDGRIAQWTGVIKKLELDSAYTPGIQMKMPSINKCVFGSKRLSTDYLFLKVSEENKSKWEKYNVGDKLKFKAILADSGFFPSVELSVFDEEEDCLLKIGIKDSYPENE
ncbi:hypothetical protein [Marinicellulosiphila megalodicopiae]|uniref:hypothetical protein n=1 Tax=Marinicellulosiphila megalodicopiae TaxID=2724896 RepID=UPI003BAFC787